MNRRFIKTLEKELPLLVQKGIVDRTTSENINNYYKDIDSSTSGNTVLTIVGSLAALLIGAGIILLFAYNWNSISTALKTFISFIPLIAGQCLVFLTVSKKKSPVWQEFSSIILSLAVGSVMALISQIYQIPGDLGNFLLIWMLLILPLNYLTDSTGILVIYLTGILFWSGYSQASNSHAVWYWLLLLSLVPKLIMLRKREPHSGKTAAVSWLMALNFLIGTGISLEKAVPGLWILIYGFLLSCSYLIGYIYYRNYHGFSNPFRTIGSAGIVILSYVFTFSFFWEEIGFNDFRHEWGIIERAAIADYILLLILAVSVIFLLIKKIKGIDSKKILPFLSISILTIPAFIIGSVSDTVLPQIIIFNIYTAFLGAWIMSRGIKNKQLYLTNLGLLTVLLIIVTRFFDMEIGFTSKGIIFIALGIGFLLINKYLSRKMVKKEDKT